jgi:hypothetical protein
LKQYTSLVL